jgi:hypothetical protein
MMNTYSNWALNVNNYVIEQCLKFCNYDNYVIEQCLNFDNYVIEQ